MSVLKWKVNSSSNFALFLFVMTHNSSVNFKVIPFLIWTKGPHQSSNFDTLKCCGENLPNFSCLFSNHWSVFLQNLHNFSVSWKITPLYFCSSNNIYKEPIKKKKLTFRVLRSNFVKFMSILKRQVSSSSIFVSFFIIMTHNSTVNLKLIHFLLWRKGSYQSSNFDTFKCSGENLQSSSCHFPSNKSVFLQILHHSSISWKITPLYFFSSKNTYFAQKESIKMKIFETFEYSG